MGSSPLVPMSADQESIVEPGKLSVITEEINVPFDAFWDEVTETVKYPVGPRVEAVLKEVKVEDTGPDEFTVMLVLDGQKLSAYGYGHKEKPGMDMVASYNKFHHDKAAKKVVNWVYGPASGFFMEDLEKYEGKPCLKTTVVYHENPLRAEYWWETTECPENGLSPNTRYSDETVKGVLSVIFEGVAAKFASMKVTAMADQASPSGGGEKSVVSNTLSEDEVTFAALMDGLIQIIKEAPAPPGTEDGGVTDVSDTQFTMTRTIKPATGTVEMLTTVTYDKEKGTVVSEQKSNGVVVQTEHYVLHKSPLQFEGWTVDGEGVRKSTKARTRQYQQLWNAAYAKATSANSWFW